MTSARSIQVLALIVLVEFLASPSCNPSSQPASVSSAQSSAAQFTIDFELVSSQRVTRTEFDYTYQATITNSGDDASAVSATVLSESPATLVVDDFVDFGDVPASASLLALDTFTIRQDRTVPFDPTLLTFQIPATPGPGVGVLLPGPSTTPASSIIRDFEADESAFEPRHFEVPSLVPVDADHLTLVFDPQATVAEANAVLASLSARIVSMAPGFPGVVLRISPSGSPAELFQTLAVARTFPAVTASIPSLVSQLPASPGPFQGGFSHIDHHLAVRAHGAWNLRHRIDTTFRGPQFVVADFFGRGMPFDGLDAELNQDDFASALSSSSGTCGGAIEHGYRVLGVIAGDFANDGSERGAVTGLFQGQPLAGRAPIKVIDLAKRHRPSLLGWVRALDADMLEIYRQLIEAVDRERTGIVVNTSLALCGPGVCSNTQCPDADFTGPEVSAFGETLNVGEAFLDYAGLWRRAVAANNLSSRFVHVTAAGNAPGLPAHLVSPFALAATSVPQLLEDPAAGGVPPLDNVIIVEGHDVAIDPEDGAFVPGCLLGSSGNIGAIGKDVLSISGPHASDGASDDSGSSYASPQVAALVGLLMNLPAQSLFPSQIRELLQETSQGVKCLAGEPGARVIDAYAAVLARDGEVVSCGRAGPFAPNEISPSCAPFRNALLDVGSGAIGSCSTDPDGVFDEVDVSIWVEVLTRQEPDEEVSCSVGLPAGVANSSTDRDYSRFDLNGDGFTGGTRGAEFDLDLDTESDGKLADQAILCFYIDSGLLDTDAEAVARLRPQVCGGEFVIYGEDTGPFWLGRLDPMTGVISPIATLDLEFANLFGFFDPATEQIWGLDGGVPPFRVILEVVTLDTRSGAIARADLPFNSVSLFHYITDPRSETDFLMYREAADGPLRLGRLDPMTGVVSPIATVAEAAGAAHQFDPATEQIVGTSGSTIVSVDSRTGAVTTVEASRGVFRLIVDPRSETDFVIYTEDTGGLWLGRLDPMTGVISPIAPLAEDVGSLELLTLEFDPATEQMVGWVPWVNQVISVDSRSGAVSRVDVSPDLIGLFVDPR